MNRNAMMGILIATVLPYIKEELPKYKGHEQSQESIGYMLTKAAEKRERKRQKKENDKEKQRR